METRFHHLPPRDNCAKCDGDGHYEEDHPEGGRMDIRCPCTDSFVMSVGVEDEAVPGDDASAAPAWSEDDCTMVHTLACLGVC